MLNQPLFDKLLQLRLPAFRDGLREQQDNPQYRRLSFEERLALLVDQECLRRHDQSHPAPDQGSRFPHAGHHRRPGSVPCPWPGAPHRSSNWPRATGSTTTITCLSSVPPAVEKLILACAFGNAAARNGFSVRLLPHFRLLHQLTQARQDGSYHTLLRSLAKLNLLILDDWMRDPLTVQNAQDLLEILDDRFGHSSTIIASQVPVTDWHLRIPDPTLADAILDRLVHNAHRLALQGKSQRKLRAIQA